MTSWFPGGLPLWKRKGCQKILLKNFQGLARFWRRDLQEQEIKEANTGTHVFIQLFVTPIDAMEDVAVDIYL